MAFDLSTEFGQHVADRLEREILIWLTTIGHRSGSPLPSVVWFLWTGSDVLVLSRPSKPKLRNIEANRRVALNLQAENGGDDVAVLSAEAFYDRGGITADEWSAYVDKYRSHIERIGFAGPDAYRASYSELIRIKPLAIRGFH